MMAKLIALASVVCVLGRVWGYQEDNSWTNYQAPSSYQLPAPWAWPKKGILNRQALLANLSPAQSALLAFVSNSTSVSPLKIS